jgi:hypothetical protein
LVVRIAFRGRDRADQTRGGNRGRRYRRRTSHETRGVAARLVTKEAGLYGVSSEELFKAGLGKVMRANSIRLSRQGEAVPFHVRGDTLYFVSGGAEANPYGNEAVYELELGIAGERMATGSAVPSGEPTTYYWERILKEENRLYQATLVEAPDLWLWSMLFAPAKKSFGFEVSALATQSAELSVWLQGASDFAADPDHHVRLYVNGFFVGEESWDGKEPKRMDAELGEGILHDGENQLEIQNVGDTEASYSMVILDRFAVSYPRRPEAVGGRLQGVWDTRGTAEIRGARVQTIILEETEDGFVWLSGAEPTESGIRFRAEADRGYLVVSPEAVRKVSEIRSPLKSVLKDKRNGADYLMIGPREFIRTARELQEVRRRQGLRVKSVTLEEVYSEFGFGEETPRAIKDFIAYAYHQWERSPRYVLLLGDGTFDFKNYLGTSVVNRVPPLMIRTTYIETASDPTFAAVNGEDLLPDLAIGRLPAATVEELETMVAKIVAWESSGHTVQGRTILVADNPDRGGDFVAAAENLATTVLNRRELDRIYLSELGTTVTRDRIRQAFDEGASLASYIGHGGIHLWADENILSIDDVETLAPQVEQPVLLTMNCLNGYFHFPYFDSLSEVLVKADGKGAIAAFSPSGLSLNDAAHVYHQKVLEALLQGDHERLGDAVMSAQAAYAETGAFPELLSIFHLFGDPAMKLR